MKPCGSEPVCDEDRTSSTAGVGPPFNTSSTIDSLLAGDAVVPANGDLVVCSSRVALAPAAAGDDDPLGDRREPAGDEGFDLPDDPDATLLPFFRRIRLPFVTTGDGGTSREVGEVEADVAAGCGVEGGVLLLPLLALSPPPIPFLIREPPVAGPRDLRRIDDMCGWNVVVCG